MSDDDPGLAYLYETMANNYMSLRQYSEAVNYFGKVLELDPNFERRDDIYLKLADSYHRLTNHQRALESYQKILELKQLTGDRRDLIPLYIQIAHCYFRLDQFEKSLLVTLEGLRRQPRNKIERAELRSYLTDNYYELGRCREAIDEASKTLKIARKFHGDNIFYVRLALSYYKIGDSANFKRCRALCRKRFRHDSWINYLDKLM
ncbi:MAG: tetratricopeptide repeat protein [Acidobacteria bacterium]|nr:tetratricopeptide repeat protein [Acidobacteriota bacterium]